MTAELNRLADDMLPKEDERKGKDGRKPKQHSQQHKDLRQRLVESWDGKVTPCSGSMIVTLTLQLVTPVNTSRVQGYAEYVADRDT